MLIVFTSQPYRQFIPARFGRVVSADVNEGALRMQLELGSRARASDPQAWERFVLAGPNPSEQSEIWVFRVEDDRPSQRPPVEYATSDQDERAWRDTIERLAPDGDYRVAVFLRVAAVRPAEAGADEQIDAPYHLLAERPYVVRVTSYNPHLAHEAIREARLVPLYDELATAVVIDHAAGIPLDGTIDVLLAAIVGGPGWLELNVSLGVDLIPAASLGWVAEGLSATQIETRQAEPVSGPSIAALRLEPNDPVAEAAVRAFAVAVGGGLDAALRLRLLRYLREIAPAETRLREAEAIALYALDRFEEAHVLLADVPLDSLGAEGRATLLATILRGGHLPEPIERVRMADLSRPEVFRLVLDASASLEAADQVRLASFVARHVLSEERSSEWFATLSERPLPAAELHGLLSAWSELDPPRAEAARRRLSIAGRLDG